MLQPIANLVLIGAKMFKVSACKVDGICANHSHWTASTNWEALGLVMKLEMRSYQIWNKFFN